MTPREAIGIGLRVGLRSSSRRALAVYALGLLLAGLAGCGSGDVVLPADPAGTALFQHGQELLEQEKWSRAAEAFDTLLRNYPTSPHLPAARLGLGRAYYEQNRSDTLLLAVDAFKNFITFHPSHPQVDYAQLMVAMSYMRLMRAPDRDQSYTKQALEEFEAFMEDYPDSSYRDMARENMQRVIDTLADHELRVARFYLGRHRWAAARARCDYALRKYPTSSHRCDILFAAGEAMRRAGKPEEAAAYYRQLVEQHGDCPRAADARRWLEGSGRLTAGGA